MFDDDTDIPDGGRAGMPAGGERGTRGRATHAWADPRSDDEGDQRPSVLIPENPWTEPQSSRGDEEQRRSRWAVLLLVLACIVGGTVFYVLHQSHLFTRGHPAAVPQVSDVTSAPGRPTKPPVAPTAASPDTRSAVLEIGGALPGGARITVNGSPLASQRVTLDSGVYVVQVSAPGYRDLSQTLRLSAGRTMVWTPHLLKSTAPLTNPAPLPAPRREPRQVARRPPPAERPVPRRRLADPPPPARQLTQAPPPRHAAPVAHAAPPVPTRVAPTPIAPVPSTSTVSCASAYGRHEWSTAAAACEREAQAGDPNAERNLAVMYDAGLGVARNHVVAAQWFQRAAAAGSQDAEYQLGTMYQDGRGVRRDAAEAVRWFRKAALQGDPDAEVKLGVAYENGAGVARDPSQAMHWYGKAAEQGNVWAQNHIGWMYASGQGVAIDYAAAVGWFRRAAEQGDAQAQYNLGYMYERGLGVERSITEASAWYHRAARQGNADARRALQLWGVQP